MTATPTPAAARSWVEPNHPATRTAAEAVRARNPGDLRVSFDPVTVDGESVWRCTLNWPHEVERVATRLRVRTREPETVLAAFTARLLGRIGHGISPRRSLAGAAEWSTEEILQWSLALVTNGTSSTYRVTLDPPDAWESLDVPGLIRGLAGVLSVGDGQVTCTALDRHSYHVTITASSGVRDAAGRVIGNVLRAVARLDHPGQVQVTALTGGVA